MTRYLGGLSQNRSLRFGIVPGSSPNVLRRFPFRTDRDCLVWSAVGWSGLTVDREDRGRPEVPLGPVDRGRSGPGDSVGRVRPGLESRVSEGRGPDQEKNRWENPPTHRRRTLYSGRSGVGTSQWASTDSDGRGGVYVW